MSEPLTKRIITLMPKLLVEAIDDYRFGYRVPSRAEAIRRLLVLGLQAIEAQKPPHRRKAS